MRLGIIGLGRMGMNMARRLVEGGHGVVVFNRSADKVKEAEGFGAKGSESVEDLVELLADGEGPRIVWLMVPSGDVTEAMIEEVSGYLTKGDIIIDGGNTLYKDDLLRSEKLKKSGIEYMDVGTSGGIWGLTVGYCLMVGGDKGVFEVLEPIFKTLAPKDGYMYCGASGAGHYIKMVHNGIEYGMMEAYGEGFELIEASPYGNDIEFADVAALWNKGSVVRSWLLELLESAFEKDDRLESLKPYVEDSGEGRWTVNEAIERSVSLPVITAALFRRFRSRDDNSFAERVLAALRNEFGGHEVKKS